MIVLDSDHLSLLEHPESPTTQRLLNRMDKSPDQEFATTVISLEEQLRGWLAVINRYSDIPRQIAASRQSSFHQNDPLFRPALDIDLKSIHDALSYSLILPRPA